MRGGALWDTDWSERGQARTNQTSTECTEHSWDGMNGASWMFHFFLANNIPVALTLRPEYTSRTYYWQKWCYLLLFIVAHVYTPPPHPRDFIISVYCPFVRDSVLSLRVCVFLVCVCSSRLNWPMRGQDSTESFQQPVIHWLSQLAQTQSQKSLIKV